MRELECLKSERAVKAEISPYRGIINPRCCKSAAGECATTPGRFYFYRATLQVNTAVM